MRSLLALMLLLLGVSPAPAHPWAKALNTTAPRYYAVSPTYAASAVRIPVEAYAVSRLASHGASCTAVATGPGWTLFLGCAHAYEGGQLKKRATVDVYKPVPTGDRVVGQELLAVDYERDLSLWVLNVGPLPYVCHVAYQGYQPSPRLLSVGYDEMVRPPVAADATIVGSEDGTTLTREIPWHGRSGGALIDADTGYLIGVVQGYEIGGGRRGRYISHATILTFLRAHPLAADPRTMPNLLTAQAPYSRPRSEGYYRSPRLRQQPAPRIPDQRPYDPKVDPPLGPYLSEQIHDPSTGKWETMPFMVNPDYRSPVPGAPCRPPVLARQPPVRLPTPRLALPPHSCPT